MDNLRGRCAVVTGGGSGIGRSTCLALAEEGVDLVISDIEEFAAQAVCDEVRSRGVDAIAVQTDVSRLDDVERLADAAYGHFTNVDILVNNAGVNFRPFRAVWDTSYADFRWVVGVNLWGVIHGVHVFVPRMRQQPGDKHIVNVASMATLFKVPGSSAYTMTKAAVDGFSEVIREELRSSDIGVTVVYPGRVHTNVANSVRLRPPEEQAANGQVKDYLSYAREEGADPASISAEPGALAVQMIGAGETGTGIDAELVGPMIVAAVRENRPSCMTHPAPVEGIEARARQLLDAFRPLQP